MSACQTCGFELWIPVAARNAVTVGLYNDALFPGRCILSLNEHFEHLDQLPPHLAMRFMRAQQDVALAIKVVMEVERVNVAVLGNTEPHVHAHIIPRSAEEPAPTRTPWEHPHYDQREKLLDYEVARLVVLLQRELARQNKGWGPP